MREGRPFEGCRLRIRREREKIKKKGRERERERERGELKKKKKIGEKVEPEADWLWCERVMVEESLKA